MPRIRKLIGPRVLIEKLPDVEVSKGGIILPRVARERCQIAEVLATGSYPNGTLIDVKEGEYVMYDHFIDYRNFVWDDKDLMVLDVSDCYLVFSEVRF